MAHRSTWSRRISLAGLGLILAASAGEPAEGQDNPLGRFIRQAVGLQSEAERRFTQGREAAGQSDFKAACDHYAAAIRQDPALFGRDPYSIQQAFRQAGRMKDLVELIKEIDLAKTGQVWPITDLVRTLLDDEKSRQDGLTVLKKAWDSFPEQRLSLLGSLYSDAAWKLPELYEYARQALKPSPEQVRADPWAGIGDAMAYSGDGRAIGLLTHVIQAAELHRKSGQLTQELEATLQTVPNWHAGKGLLAVLYGRSGRVEEAREILTELTEVREPPITSRAAWVIGQDLENVAELRPLVVTLYEKAIESLGNEPGRQFRYSPMPRLVRLYEATGRREEARSLLIRAAAEPPKPEQYNPGYAEYRHLDDLDAIGGELLRTGYPIDAVRVYQRALQDRTAVAAANRWGGNLDQQLEQGLKNARAALNPDTYAQSLLAMTSPEGRPADAQGPAVDLILFVQPADLGSAEVGSLFGQAVASVATSRPDALAEIDANLRRLGKAAKRDVSVAVARALVAFGGGDESAMLATAEDALESADAAQTVNEVAPETTSQQHVPAEIGLWLVARAAWKHAATQEVADLLADAALRAARRHPDSLWALAMLRERGERALGQGDRQRAEQAWSEMLDLILGGEAPNPAPPGVRTSRLDAAPSAGGVRGVLLWSAVGEVVPAGAAPQPLTPERFQAAMQVARLAAENDMEELSLRAVRGALAAGAPVTRTPQGVVSVEISRAVEEQVAAITAIWKRRGFQSGRVYLVLADVVLPPGRPGEVLLYNVPLAESGAQQPRSVGRILADAAVAAEMADDVEQRLRDAAGAGGDVRAEVLRGLLALARKDVSGANAVLAALKARLLKSVDAGATDTIPAELACHVAIPALARKESADAAVVVLDLAVASLSRQDSEEPVAGLALALARIHFGQGRTDRGKQSLETYLEACQKMNVRYGGEYGLVRRKQQLQRVAQELVRAGELEAALDALSEESEIVLMQRWGETAAAPATASLARMFAAQSADARYRLIRNWIMPRPNRRSVRLVTEFVPSTPPPAAFAQALGKESSDDAFPRPGAGLSGDVFCSAAALVDAAREAGRLDELAADCAAWQAQKVEHADLLSLLIGIAQGRPNDVLPRLKTYAANMKANLPAQGDYNRPVDLTQYVVANAAAAVPQLRAQAVDMLQTLVTHSQRIQNGGVRPRLRRALAIARLLAADSDPALLESPDLALWDAAADETAAISAAGPAPDVWVTQEGHVAHISGPFAQYLYFAYPLTGTFEISADVFDGGWAEGGLSFGGHVVETFAHNRTGEVFSVGHQGKAKGPTPAVRRGFNRYTVRCTPGSTQFLVNGSLFHDAGPAGAEFPWYALYGNRERQTVFRDIVVTGEPEIPREVQLVHGDSLLGWTSQFYAETQPAPVGTRVRVTETGYTYDAAPADAGYDWTAADGVIHGRRLPGGPQADAVQSLLAWHRPLRDGDTLSYEFLHVPGEYDAHPALGRLAFLLEPEGVRLHWMTDGPDKDWTGLPSDNNVAVPGGAAALPLRSGEWNQVTLTLDGDTARVALNGEEVCGCPLDPVVERRFGLFHYKDRSAVQVRNVVLRGDWPERLSPALLANLVGPLTPQAATKDRRALSMFFAEDQLREFAYTIYRRARALPAEERFEFLARYVLPGEEHAGFRLYGDYTPTYPAPPVDPTLRGDDPAATAGGELVAPALLLVETARELGRLDELHERTSTAVVADNVGLSAQTALLALIRMEQGNHIEAQRSLEELLAFVLMLPKGTPEAQRWDGLVAATAAMRHPRLRKAAVDMLDLIVKQAQDQGGMRDQWNRWIRHTRARARELTRLEEQGVAWGDDPGLEYWLPAVHATSYSSGEGLPKPHWEFVNGELRHRPGNARDYMYLRVPLRGDFEMQCQLSGFGWREAYVAYDGLRLGLKHDRKSFELDRYGHFIPEGKIDPPIGAIGDFYDYRLVVRGGMSEHYVNGRKIYERPLSPVVDPWLGLHAFAHCDAAVRNLTISGSPEIPDRLELTANPELVGWKADYYGEQINSESGWRMDGDVIVGARRAGAAGSIQESILRYHRPIAEDGEIEYEFLHQPGAVVGHPALDKLVFLLEPEGVRVHWLTDGEHERTGLTPDNVADEPEHRRGGGRLPLRPGQWNRVRLALAGDVATLTLNGMLVYERPLEPTNQRTFGLFHYKDAAEVRVRNVTWRGDWPKELPPAGRLFPPAVSSAGG